MVFANTLLATSALIMAAFSSVQASIAPSYPSPGTVWTEGKEYEILWADDGTSPSLSSGWSNFTIDFMTGDNLQQTRLSTVATGLNGAKASSYKWTAPTVTPHAAIYFFMFTNGADGSAWTTRFGIVGADGALAEPTNSTQSDGSKIPWGTGSLAKGSSSESSSTASSAAGGASMISSASSPAVAPVGSASAPVASENIVSSIAPSAAPSVAPSAADSAADSAPVNSAKESSSNASTAQQSSTTTKDSGSSFTKPAAGLAVAITALSGFLMSL
ncbi:hypothetical protein J3Q64DRAFT_1840633 [Phycomyces blakesleeanus]|uniref:Yeast cell wall synthesis Kre9/Knh1-like N-terminal domain-containing protein n=1 Tax=Phycomyces blakesleeanus TaxID=4837 RepID=A0ABR3ALW6_PHYBL